MTINDWIVAGLCAIVDLVVIVGCIVDLRHLKKAKEEKE